MITVSKSQLKARMLEYFRHVEESGEELLVTSHRKPVLKVVPLKPHRAPADAFAAIREKGAAYGDITEPETEEWGDV